MQLSIARWSVRSTMRCVFQSDSYSARPIVAYGASCARYSSSTATRRLTRSRSTMRAAPIEDAVFANTEVLEHPRMHRFVAMARPGVAVQQHATAPEDTA